MFHLKSLTHPCLTLLSVVSSKKDEPADDGFFKKPVFKVTHIDRSLEKSIAMTQNPELNPKYAAFYHRVFKENDLGRAKQSEGQGGNGGSTGEEGEAGAGPTLHCQENPRRVKK